MTVTSGVVGDLPCPTCRRTNQCHDSGTTPGGTPADGDLSICWACRCPAVYERNPLGVLGLRQPTDAEWEQIQRDPQVTAALNALAASRTPHQAVERTRREQTADQEGPATE